MRGAESSRIDYFLRWVVRRVLGIRVEYTEPGHPQQNGRHERMHLTLKQDIKLGKTILQQQEYLDYFRGQHNTVRPHEARAMKCPADIYSPSTKSFTEELEPLEYPGFDKIKKVSPSGKVHFNDKREYFFISEVLAGENIGLKEEEDKIWRVNFINIELGFLDTKNMKFSAIQELIYSEPN